MQKNIMFFVFNLYRTGQLDVKMIQMNLSKFRSKEKKNN